MPPPPRPPLNSTQKGLTAFFQPVAKRARLADPPRALDNPNPTSPSEPASSPHTPTVVPPASPRPFLTIHGRPVPVHPDGTVADGAISDAPPTTTKALPAEETTPNTPTTATTTTTTTATTNPRTSLDKNHPTELADLLTEPSWRSALQKEFSAAYWSKLASFVAQERRSHGNGIFPPESDIFKAYQECPLSRTSVVILGQDPYHGPGQAMGLCFSVNRGQRVPPRWDNDETENRDIDRSWSATNSHCSVPFHIHIHIHIHIHSNPTPPPPLLFPVVSKISSRNSRAISAPRPSPVPHTAIFRPGPRKAYSC